MTPPESVVEAAERHVQSGRRVVAAQEALVARMRANGDDYAAAESLLTEFRRSLAIFEDDLIQLSQRPRIRPKKSG